MVLTVNKGIVLNICNDETFDNEIKEFLKSVVESELEKGDGMNTELIDECVEFLFELEEGSSGYVGENIIKLCHKEVRKKGKTPKYVAASVALILLMLSAFAVTNPVKAGDMFAKIAQSLGIAADSTAVDYSDIVSVYGEYSSVDLTVKDKNDIDLSSVKVYAVLKDNTEKEINIKDCKITYNELENNKIMAIVSYEGSAFSIIFNKEA